MKVDYYEILGVSKNATQRDIEIAFRKLVTKYHPDKYKTQGGEPYRKAVEKFTLINEAYEVLRDPEKRREYDEAFRTGNFIPESLKKKKIQAMNLLKMGKESLEKGEDSKAAMYFRSGLSLDPDNMLIRAYLALSYARDERTKGEVLRLVDKIEKKKKEIDSAEVFLISVRALLAVGEKKRALLLCEEGVKIFPKSEKLNKFYKEIKGKSFLKFFSFGSK